MNKLRSEGEFPARSAFLGLMVLALGLRLANSALASLKLDDFHSLYHARAADLATFFEVLLRDNHPPLSFLLVRGARALFGESQWALRLPALLAGLATIALVWRLGRRFASTRARCAATLLLAASSLHLEISSDVRMYSLLALASAGLLDGLVDLLEEGRGRGRTALWTFVGLHTHYHFLYALSVLGAAACLLTCTAQPYRANRRPLLTGLAAGVLASLPWYLLAFPTQLAHGLAPGGSHVGVSRLLEGLMHLVFLNVSVAGPIWYALWLVASGLVLLLAGCGAWSLLRAAPRERRLAFPVLLALLAFACPTLAALAASVSARAGFDWRYLAGALSAFCLLAGSQANALGALARTRRAALALVATSAVLLAAWNVHDPGEEDYRGAISWILERSTAGDVVIAADWQPLLFPHGLAWQYYAPRLAAGRALPESLSFTDNLSFQDPEKLREKQRVFCCLRSLPPDCGLLRTLRKHFSLEEPVLAFGRSVYVHVFTGSLSASPSAPPSAPSTRPGEPGDPR